MKLNLGCGFRTLPGWHNVDSASACAPDERVDLESTPWPWPDDSADEVLLSHVLEHLGATPAVYLAVMRDLWRVCRPDARVTVIVPHPRHDAYLIDPTHVRPITSEGLAMFSRANNARWLAEGAGNTPLGLMLGIDFEVEETRQRLDDAWRRRLDRGEVDEAAVRRAVRAENNVVIETTVVLRAVKPVRAAPGDGIPPSPPPHGITR